MKISKTLFTCLILFLLSSLSSTVLAQSKVVSKDGQYKVIINHEEQYIIWPQNQATPRGWSTTKVKGNLMKCQKYINGVWTDMRPLSVQKSYAKGGAEYQVVLEAEFLGVYMIWPASKALPRGYKATKVKGSFAKCTKHIKEVWTDMRPLSLKLGGR